MSEKRFIYILEDYLFYDASHILFVSDNFKMIMKEFEKIEKKRGYGYVITKYPLNVFFDDYGFPGKTVKHQEFREDGLCEWNGDDWVKL